MSDGFVGKLCAAIEISLLVGLSVPAVAIAQAPPPQSICIHDDVQAGVVPTLRAGGPVQSFAGTPTTAPMRIVLDDTLLQASNLNAAEKQHVIDSVRTAADWVEAALQVVPLIGDISVNGTCLSDPVNLTVSNADLVVLLSADPVAGPTLAFAAFCQVDAFGRPVAGQLNANPSFVDPNGPSLDDYIDALAHELVHILGFSSSAFASYRDGLHGPLRGIGNVVTSYAQGGKTVDAIVTPAALAAARDHFGCQTLVGAELEDQGGSGTAGSHWERRIYNREFMTGVNAPVLDDPRSQITLGLLEDSGWYLPDYSFAEPVEWAKGEGCPLAENTCDTFSARHFCDTVGSIACTADREATAFCALFTYGAALPAQFQYFADPLVGGNQLPDFCPRWNAFSNGECANPANPPQAPFGEQTGPGTACFEATLLQDIFVPDGITRPFCYVATCAATTLDVAVDGHTVQCPVDGGTIGFPGYTGALECPPFDEFCSTCGDGAITVEEVCDDGNAAPGDGCSAACTIESGWACAGVPSVCSGGLATPVPSLAPGLIAVLAGLLGAAGVLRARGPR